MIVIHLEKIFQVPTTSHCSNGAFFASQHCPMTTRWSNGDTLVIVQFMSHSLKGLNLKDFA